MQYKPTTAFLCVDNTISHLNDKTQYSAIMAIFCGLWSVKAVFLCRPVFCSDFCYVDPVVICSWSVCDLLFTVQCGYWLTVLSNCNELSQSLKYFMYTWQKVMDKSKGSVLLFNALCNYSLNTVKNCVFVSQKRNNLLVFIHFSPYFIHFPAFFLLSSDLPWHPRGIR